MALGGTGPRGDESSAELARVPAGLQRAAATAASEQLREAGAAPPRGRSPMRSHPSESGGAWAEGGKGDTAQAGGLEVGAGRRERGHGRFRKCDRGWREEPLGRRWEGARGDVGGEPPKCCISGGGAKRAPWPVPPRRRRKEGGVQCGLVIEVLHPQTNPPESPSFSDPELLA